MSHDSACDSKRDEQHMTLCRPVRLPGCRLDCYRYLAFKSSPEQPARNLNTNNGLLCDWRIDAGLYPLHMLRDLRDVDAEFSQDSTREQHGTSN